jgi:DNA-binding beta-propeller fold protein YncE
MNSKAKLSTAAAVKSAIGAAAISATTLFAMGATASAAGFLPTEKTVSTVNGSGDLNPYGVNFVPAGFPTGGAIKTGDILVANFNSLTNTQGTGTTITLVPASGAAPSTFFQAPACSITAKDCPMGLTAAQTVLSGGQVITGYLPVPDGTFKTAEAGGLLITDKHGKLLFNYQGGGLVSGQSLSSDLQGPWGMAVQDLGAKGAVLYISNVLSGTVIRSEVTFTGGAFNHTTKIIAQHLGHENDANGFLLGPSGLAYDAATDVLYVANSHDNTISEIQHASTATVPQPVTVITSDATHLHGPLTLQFAPNGDLLVANSDGSNGDPAQPSEIVEFTLKGQFVKQFNVDASEGGAFGIAVQALPNNQSELAYSNDNGGGGAVPTLTTITLAN